MHVRYTKGSMSCKSLFCPSTECPRLQTHVVRQEEKEGSKLPSNPEEVEDLRWDTIVNPLIAFTFSELKLITGNFRQDHVLGVGGFVRVYKGLISEDLRDGLQPLQVAVKVHDGDNSHRGHREWLAEIVRFNRFLGAASWSKAFVKKWFNIKSKGQDNHVDEIASKASSSTASVSEDRDDLSLSDPDHYALIASDSFVKENVAALKLNERILSSLSKRSVAAHPWHDLETGKEAPLCSMWSRLKNLELVEVSWGCVICDLHCLSFCLISFDSSSDSGREEKTDLQWACFSSSSETALLRSRLKNLELVEVSWGCVICDLHCLSFCLISFDSSSDSGREEKTDLQWACFSSSSETALLRSRLKNLELVEVSWGCVICDLHCLSFCLISFDSSSDSGREEKTDLQWACFSSSSETALLRSRLKNLELVEVSWGCVICDLHCLSFCLISFDSSSDSGREEKTDLQWACFSSSSETALLR
ncbi:hypothetical protein ZIOFF_017720 [Zingiber officinale]|uniref:Uncharacterized protein n=1 Tax=Zingiber officinale TaxID=94328 RepID=A0A8J5HC30_ZINOF|nr:hypothetical protein ZIOFF_017720 [Zingiber officinale]